MKPSKSWLPLMKNCNARKGPGAWRSSCQAKIFQLFFLPLKAETQKVTLNVERRSFKRKIKQYCNILFRQYTISNESQEWFALACYKQQNTQNPNDVWQPVVENQQPTHFIVTNCLMTKFLWAESATNPLYPVWKNCWRTSKR